MPLILVEECKCTVDVFGKYTLMPCAVATCLFSTSSDLFPTRIFWTFSGAYCGGVAKKKDKQRMQTGATSVCRV